MKNDRFNALDIFHFEKKLQEIIYEVQRKTNEMDKLENGNLQIRKELYSVQSLWQNEQRISQDLGIRLKLAMETINRLQEDKIRDKIDYSNLSINYASVLKERDSLAKKVLSSQTDVVKYKIKLENLETKLRRESQRRESFERALMKLQTDNAEIITNIDMNIVKISKEHKYLMEKTRSVIELNKRLQTIGLCFHAINEKNKAEIKNLQHKLLTVSMNESNVLYNNKLHPEIENLCFKLKDMLKKLRET